MAKNKRVIRYAGIVTNKAMETGRRSPIEGIAYDAWQSLPDLYTVHISDREFHVSEYKYSDFGLGLEVTVSVKAKTGWLRIFSEESKDVIVMEDGISPDAERISSPAMEATAIRMRERMQRDAGEPTDRDLKKKIDLHVRQTSETQKADGASNHNSQILKEHPQLEILGMNGLDVRMSSENPFNLDPLEREEEELIEVLAGPIQWVRDWGFGTSVCVPDSRLIPGIQPFLLRCIPNPHLAFHWRVGIELEPPHEPLAIWTAEHLSRSVGPGILDPAYGQTDNPTVSVIDGFWELDWDASDDWWSPRNWNRLEKIASSLLEMPFPEGGG